MDMTFFFLKGGLIVVSFLATVLSLIFMLAPAFFSRIEEFLGLEVGGSVVMLTVLEGRVMFVHDWAFNNRFVLGPLLSVLAAINTRNAVYLPTPI